MRDTGIGCARCCAPFPPLFAHRDALKRAAVFYARNIDQLLLALLARLICASRAPVAYEVLDIPPILMRRGPVPTLLRAIERLCLRRISLLVLSSPAFHRNYYAAVQKYRGDVVPAREQAASLDLLAAAGAVRRAAERGRPWVVGYFGLIRGESTFALMTRLAERLQGRILFKFGGILTTVDQAKFDEVLRRCPNIVYGGPYLPQQDLEDLYRDVDFTWALDLEHTDHNSRWLMPCRFYEAGLLRSPLPRRAWLRSRQHRREAPDRLDLRRAPRGVAGPLLRAPDAGRLRAHPRTAALGAAQHVRGRRRCRPACAR